MLLPVKRVIHEVSSGDHTSGVFTNDNLAGNAIPLHKLRNQDVFTKDVVPSYFRSDNPPYDPACVDAYSDVEVAEKGVFETTALLLYDLSHLKSHLEQTVCLVDGVFDRALFPLDLARVAHNNVSVSECMHFVDSVLLAKSVEL